MPPDEKKRIEIKESLCVVDGEYFFRCGRLTIPINGSDQDLVFNVRTSISEDNFIKRNQLWNNPKRTKEEPYENYDDKIKDPLDWNGDYILTQRNK